MALYAIRVDSDHDYGIFQGNDAEEAIENAYDSLGIEWDATDDLLVDNIRPATVREALVHEYGEGWEGSISHLVEVASRMETTYVKTLTGFPNYRTDFIECVVLSHTEGRNVWGYEEPVGVSNFRLLMEAWADLEGLSSGPYSGQDFVALDLDMSAPEDLIEVLDALENYPVLSDELHSQVEQEMIDEHWHIYGRDDVLDAVAKAIGLGCRTDLSNTAETMVNMLVWEGILDYGCGGGYPYMIDSSACDFGEEDVARFFADNLGGVITLKTHNGFGPELRFDLREHNLVDGLAVAN